MSVEFVYISKGVCLPVLMWLRLLNISFEALTQTLKTDMAPTLKMNYLNLMTCISVVLVRWVCLH